MRTPNGAERREASYVLMPRVINVGLIFAGVWLVVLRFRNLSNARAGFFCVELFKLVARMQFFYCIKLLTLQNIHKYKKCTCFRF